jgi:hypothetical protein
MPGDYPERGPEERAAPTGPSDGNVCTRFGSTYARWKTTYARWKSTSVDWTNTCATKRRRARGGTDNGTILRTAVSANRTEFRPTA